MYGNLVLYSKDILVRFLPVWIFSFSLCIHGKPPPTTSTGRVLSAGPASCYLGRASLRNPCSSLHQRGRKTLHIQNQKQGEKTSYFPCWCECCSETKLNLLIQTDSTVKNDILGCSCVKQCKSVTKEHFHNN